MASNGLDVTEQGVDEFMAENADKTVLQEDVQIRHIMLRLEATTPSGERADWLDQSLVVANTQEVVSLPFAHNDPRGEWTIRAIDLLTNDVATTSVTLE